MKILFTTPCLRPHGGILNIIYLANALHRNGYEVTIWDQSGEGNKTWKPIECELTYKLTNKYDLSVICSPHASYLLDQPGKKIVWMQMIEHKFRPQDFYFKSLCYRFYLADCPVISSASWGADYIKELGQINPVHVIPTGIDLGDFPIVETPKYSQSILLESPEPTNPAKDIERVALKVAMKLRKEYGVKLIGYGAIKPVGYKLDEFHVKPTLEIINQLYDRSIFLLKATRFDFRSTAPLEAMTKGTPTVRGIIEGDEDLILNNSIVTDYDEDQLYKAATELLDNEQKRENLAINCISFIRNQTWENLLPQYIKAFECA